VANCCEASRSDPRRNSPAAHESYNRLLQRLEPDPETLFQEVQSLVDKTCGVFVIDDSTLDKPYAQKIELVSHHWSGKHHTVVKGISLLSMDWRDGDLMLPVDYRVYDKAGDGKTKNDHFRNMLDTDELSGFKPKAILFDSWRILMPSVGRLNCEFDLSAGYATLL
jgi:hypothetical protein